MRAVRLTNAAGRDTTVRYEATKTPPSPAQGRGGQPAKFRRYLAATEEGLHDALVGAHGENYAQALVDGDPEVDMESIGRAIEQTQVVFLASGGEVMHAAPELVEVLFAASGEERERRSPEDVESNVGAEAPIRWTNRRMKRADVVRRFVLRRALQIHHVDGLTFDYLHDIAKDLHESGEMVLVGGGDKGKSPLVFHTNATPYRAFLEGRVDGDRFQLLLHLSNMELKRPEPKSK